MEELRAAGKGVGHLLFDDGPLLLGVKRPDRDALLGARADSQPPHLGEELLDDLVRDLLEDVEALDGQARLTAVEEPPDAGRAHGGIHVGVRADDHGVRASELERQALGALGGHGHDLPADRGRARERDLAHGGMLDEQRAELRSLACHDVQHARGETRLVHQLGDAKRRQRRRLRGLRHHRVAGHDRRAELVAEEGGREVPGHDRDDDPERAPEDQPVRSLVEVRDVAAAEALRETGVMLERVDEARDLEPGLAERLALLPRQEERERLEVSEHVLGRGAQHLPSGRRRQLRPRRERASRRLDGQLDLPPARARRRPDLLAGGRVADPSPVETVPGEKGPADEHAALRARLDDRHQRPVNSGARFSTNAAMPSFASSVLNRASISSCSRRRPASSGCCAPSWTASLIEPIARCAPAASALQ